MKAKAVEIGLSDYLGYLHEMGVSVFQTSLKTKGKVSHITWL